MSTTGHGSLNAAPTRLLGTQAAQVYAHLHPILVLSTIYLQFASLVESPEAALSIFLAPLALSQFLYCVICLSPIGSADSTSKTPKVAGSGRKKTGGASKSPQSTTVATRISTAFLATLLALLAGTPLITVTLILFGAPATTHLSHTIFCSSHMALLSATPLVYVHGVSISTWRKIGAFMLPIDEVFGAAIGTMLGAWLGAIPIPLDWDRDWQKWPVTIIAGAYAGWAIGKFAGRYLFAGKIIDLTAR